MKREEKTMKDAAEAIASDRMDTDKPPRRYLDTNLGKKTMQTLEKFIPPEKELTEKEEAEELAKAEKEEPEGEIEAEEE